MNESLENFYSAIPPLHQFVQGYVETMLGLTRHVDAPAPTKGDIAREEWESTLIDCALFHARLSRDRHGRTALDSAYSATTPYGPHEAGRDFWLTRGGTGVGFWGRGLGAAGEELADIAGAFKPLESFLGDDGNVHLT